MMKRILSIFLAVVLTVSLFPAALPVSADGDIPFSDVPKSAWYYSSVVFVYQESLFFGNERNQFMPEKAITRAELVNVLYNLAGVPDVEYTSRFTDVPDGKWYSKAVTWATENNVICGTDDGSTFCPNSNVTREQIAVIIYNYAKRTGCDISARSGLSSFPDKDKLDAWAYDAVSWANVEGLIIGQANNGHILLNPLGDASRAEAAIILKRFMTSLASTALVSDAYRDEITNSNGYTHIYRIPKINLEGAGIAAINAEIYDYYYSLMEDIYETDEDVILPYEFLNYAWGQKDSTISVIVRVHTFYESSYYRVYTVSADTLDYVSDTELLQQYGLSQTEFYEMVSAALEKEYKNTWSQYSDWPDYQKQLERTVSDENVHAVVPYIDQSGDLCILGTVYSLVAADAYYHLVNITGTAAPEYP